MRLAGSEHDMLRMFLRPNGSLAASYLCTRCGCAHEVITHNEVDIVAVCRCEAQCSNIPLKKPDTIVYEVNRSALGKAVAAALKITADEAPVNGLHQTARIGFCSPFAGYRFPVVLTFQYEPEDMRVTVERLEATMDTAFVLLAPTAQLMSPPVEDLLKRKNDLFLPLVEVLELADAGAFKARPRQDDLFAKFRSQHVPQADATSTMVFFPTPADAKWKDVTIRFVDGHTVFVKVKGTTGRYLYSDMGMIDRRKAAPDSQWQLLTAFAEGNGMFTWDHPTAHKKKQKQRETLAARLQRFFRIDDDPFVYVEDTKGWQSRFTVVPET
ncbi:MAG: hypothetical protein AABZ47_05370 [Planctomycetota bacterium]